MASKILGALKSKKARPFIIGGAVLIGGIIIFMVLKNRGGGGGSAQAVSGGPSEALQAAQLQAQTQLGLAQLQANAAATQSATQLQAFMYGKDADVHIADVTMQNQALIQLAGIDAQKTIALAQEGTSQYGIQAQANVQIAGINAQTQLGAINADVERARIAASQSVSNTQTKAASKASTLGTIASAALGIFSIFSDVRTKKNITWTGIRTFDTPGKRAPAELNIYEYEYVGEFGQHRAGNIAQDIAGFRPWAVIPTTRQNRYLAVNYDAL